MKNLLILHGTNGNSQKNWFPWLKKESINKGYKVWVPDLPHADKPNIHNYNSFIFQNWNFDQNSTIIGHSSGAVQVLSLLQKLSNKIIIDKAILVAGFTDNLNWEALDGMFIEPFNYEQIKKRARKIILFHSNNDPYVPISYGEKLRNLLDVELVILKDQGHFSDSTSKKGYKKFPELLKFL